MKMFRMPDADSGNRKIWVTMWLTVPFLIVTTTGMFLFHADIVAWTKVVSEFILAVVAVFGASNAVEHIAVNLRKKEYLVPVDDEDQPKSDIGFKQ